MYHQRVILRCLEEDRVLVVTPHREIHETVLAEGSVYQEIRRVHNGRLPVGVGEDVTYLAKNSDEGPFVREEFLNLLQKAEDWRATSPRRCLTVKLGEDGKRHRILEPGVSVVEGFDAGMALVWVVVYSSEGVGWAIISCHHHPPSSKRLEARTFGSLRKVGL